MRIFAYGGGVQSNAVLVLASQGKVQYDVFLFAEVGADSENPETLRYIADVAEPFAKEHGLRLERVRWENRNHPGETLKQWTLREERSVRLPVWAKDGGMSRRACTTEFKIKPIARWTKLHGALPGAPYTVGMGISVDELQRAKSAVDPRIPWQRREYPLIDLGLHRADCLRIVADAGLPQPPKSSCTFCPFHRRADWLDLKRRQPERFAEAVELDDTLRERSIGFGRGATYLHTGRKPLSVAVADQGHFDDLLGDCEEGYCGV